MHARSHAQSQPAPIIIIHQFLACPLGALNPLSCITPRNVHSRCRRVFRCSSDKRSRHYAMHCSAGFKSSLRDHTCPRIRSWPKAMSLGRYTRVPTDPSDLAFRLHIPVEHCLLQGPVRLIAPHRRKEPICPGTIHSCIPVSSAKSIDSAALPLQNATRSLQYTDWLAVAFRKGCERVVSGHDGVTV